MRTRLVTAALAATLSSAAAPGFAQTQPPQANPPALTDEKGKAQQNSADEATPKGTLEAARDPKGSDDPKVVESNKKLEEAAEKAKPKTDGASTGATGAAKPQ
jgi:hypothetical protein